MKKLSVLLLSAVILISLAACGVSFHYPDNNVELTQISSISALKQILLKNTPNRGWYEKFNGGALAEDAANNGSQTNTQVQGVDEADTVKTNGEFVVTINNNIVYVIDVETDTIVKTFKYDPAEDAKEYRWASEIYLTDTQLIIMGTISTYSYGGGVYDVMPMRGFWWGWGGQDTFIEVIDLTTLDITASYDLKGGYFSSRLSDGQLIVIANQWQTLIYDEKNNPIVVEPTVTDKNGNVISSIGEGHAFVLPNNQGSSFVNILKIDLGSSAEPTLSSYLGWIQTVYMNASDLIIAQSRYEYNETTQVGASYTDLIRFDVDTLDMKAQGSLKGYLLNQFSLDIYNGTLRVALTNWDTTATNRVVTLDLSMNKLDSIENLAEKETIRAVRFIGDKGYVVTFENIDPLFVIDLSNPSDISVKGELKVPGFSTYLHPVSDNVLWGIAEDLTVKQVTQDGQTWNSIERFGVKISLFNVADPTHPTEITALNILGPSGYSEAQYNHKAIVLDNEKNLVYIPYADYHYDSYTCSTGEKGDTICNYTYESGIKVLHITETDVTVVKTISVSSSYDQNTWISRSLYVGNKLYLISNIGLTVLDRTSFEKIDSIAY